MFKLRLILGSAVFILGMSGIYYMQSIRADNVKLQQQNKSLQQQKQDLQGQLAFSQKQYDLAQAAYAELEAKKQAVRIRYKTIIKRVRSSPKKDDAVIAPVLANALSTLSELQ